MRLLAATIQNKMQSHCQYNVNYHKYCDYSGLIINKEDVTINTKG